MVVSVGKLPNVFTLANGIIVYYLPSNKYFQKQGSGIHIAFRAHKSVCNLQHTDRKSREQDVIRGVSMPCNDHVLGAHNQNNTNNLNIGYQGLNMAWTSVQKQEKEGLSFPVPIHHDQLSWPTCLGSDSRTEFAIQSLEAMSRPSFHVGYAFILTLSLAPWLINQQVFLCCGKYWYR